MFTLAAQLTWLRSKSTLNAGLFLSNMLIFPYVLLTYNGVIWLAEDLQNTMPSSIAR